MEYKIRCNKCGKTVSPTKWRWKDDCGGTLDVIIDYGEKTFDELLRKEEAGIRRYGELLPLKNFSKYPTGNTPILKIPTDDTETIFKLEFLSGGGSFKDRGAYVSVLRAKEMGMKDIVLASSGNSAISFSLMGLVMGIKVHTFIPSSAPEGKKNLLRILNATLHEVDGGTAKAEREAVKKGEKIGSYVGHWWNPYFIEGIKTMAYEIHEKVGKIDQMVVPVGTGTAALGLYKGFRELKQLKEINEIPTLIIVQACGHTDVCEQLGVSRNCTPSKVADGIAIVNPPRKKQIANAVKDSGGTGIIVDGKKVKESTKELINHGLIVEPTSAATYAGMKRAIDEEYIQKGKTLVPLTGTGMKVLNELKDIYDE